MRRLLKIIIYRFSRKRKQLDTYMRVIRRGHQLSDSEVTKLKALIENEKEVYAKY